MPSFRPTLPETLEDQRLYTQARLVEVSCHACDARVRVKKNSQHHTSIQWDQESLAACETFRLADTTPGGRPVHAACPRLAASIEQATGEGAVPIGAEDGY